MVQAPFFNRRAGACPPRGLKNRFFFVARGPVPRDLHRPDVCFSSVVCDRLITNRSESDDLDLQAWRADDGEGQALALREGEAFITVARGPVPRDRWRTVFFS